MPPTTSPLPSPPVSAFAPAVYLRPVCHTHTPQSDFSPAVGDNDGGREAKRRNEIRKGAFLTQRESLTWLRILINVLFPPLISCSEVCLFEAQRGHGESGARVGKWVRRGSPPPNYESKWSEASSLKWRTEKTLSPNDTTTFTKRFSQTQPFLTIAPAGLGFARSGRLFCSVKTLHSPFYCRRGGGETVFRAGQRANRVVSERPPSRKGFSASSSPSSLYCSTGNYGKKVPLIAQSRLRRRERRLVLGFMRVKAREEVSTPSSHNRPSFPPLHQLERLPALAAHLLGFHTRRFHLRPITLSSSSSHASSSKTSYNTRGRRTISGKKAYKFLRRPMPGINDASRALARNS